MFLLTWVSGEKAILEASKDSRCQLSRIPDKVIDCLIGWSCHMIVVPRFRAEILRKMSDTDFANSVLANWRCHQKMVGGMMKQQEISGEGRLDYLFNIKWMEMPEWLQMIVMEVLWKGHWEEEDEQEGKKRGVKPMKGFEVRLTDGATAMMGDIHFGEKTILRFFGIILGQWDWNPDGFETIMEAENPTVFFKFP